jgi:hypothetical protein
MVLASVLDDGKVTARLPPEIENGDNGFRKTQEQRDKRAARFCYVALKSAEQSLVLTIVKLRHVCHLRSRWGQRVSKNTRAEGQARGARLLCGLPSSFPLPAAFFYHREGLRPSRAFLILSM